MFCLYKGSLDPACKQQLKINFQVLTQFLLLHPPELYFLCHFACSPSFFLCHWQSSLSLRGQPLCSKQRFPVAKGRGQELFLGNAPRLSFLFPRPGYMAPLRFFRLETPLANFSSKGSGYPDAKLNPESLEIGVDQTI